MELKLGRFDYRGGTRFKKPLKLSSSILLRYIWLNAGGVKVLGDIFQLDCQAFVNWQTQGFVPFRNCGRIARKLGVPVYALNFDGTFELLGKGPSWKDLVYECVSDEYAREQIMKGKMPVNFKGKDK